MPKTISVIVSKCSKNSNGEFQVYDDGSRTEVKFPNMDLAKYDGEMNREREGMSVIIRPNYNEVDEKGQFFREWRSFDGEEFKECRWDI